MATDPVSGPKTVVAVFDLDKTLLGAESLNSFLAEVYRQDAKTIRRRLAQARTIPEGIQLGWYYLKYYAGYKIDPRRMAFLGTSLWRRGIPDIDVRYRSETWFDAVGREQLNQIVVEEFVDHRKRGSRPLIASSTLDFLGERVARHLDLPLEDCLCSPTQVDDDGKLTKIVDYNQAENKGNAIKRRIEAIGNVDLQRSEFYTDSRSDLRAFEVSGIQKLTAVGTDLDSFLRAHGGRRIQIVEGGVVIEKFERVSDRRFEPRPERVIGAPKMPRESRAYGRALIPFQWCYGHLVSEFVMTGQLRPVFSGESIASMALFAGAGAVGETVARETYNYFLRLPFLYAGPEVRGGTAGGAIHMIGSFAGMLSMEIYHNRHDFSIGRVINDTFLQGASWLTVRGVTTIALKAMRIQPIGNLGVQIAEMLVLPIAEFSLMKKLTDWNYRPQSIA